MGCFACVGCLENELGLRKFSWKTAAIHMSSLMTKKGRTPSLRRSSQTPMWQALLANLHCMPPAMIEGWLEQILQDDDKGAGHPCIQLHAWR